MPYFFRRFSDLLIYRLVTTHVPGLAKLLPIDSLRYITNGEGYPEVELGSDGVISRIADTLGVLPDLTPALAPHTPIRLIVCVEGIHDIAFLNAITSVLHESFPEIRPLLSVPDIILLPMGGSSLQEWVNHNYLRKLGIPEYHIYDSDCVNKHQSECDDVNHRGDGSSARMTRKREMENYLHKQAIYSIYGCEIEITDELDVPQTISAYLQTNGLRGSNPKNIKRKLNRDVAQNMTLELLNESDPDHEVLSWICDILQLDINSYTGM